MALNPHLKELIDNQKLGFEDVFELYAALCVDHIRDVTNDIIADEGIEEYVKHRGAVTVDSLTEETVDWAHVVVPEMLADIMEGPKKDNETWLEYVIRRKIEQHVFEAKSFQIKVV